MVQIIKIVGFFIILSGIAIIVNPSFLYTLIENSLDQKWLYISAIVLRASMGIFLIAAAKYSRFPFPIKFIGGITVFIAIVFLLIGQVRFQHFISSMMDALQPVTWISGVLAAITGGFLMYAFTPNVQKE